jgi:hypothetical protein
MFIFTGTCERSSSVRYSSILLHSTLRNLLYVLTSLPYSHPDYPDRPTDWSFLAHVRLFRLADRRLVFNQSVSCRAAFAVHTAEASIRFQAIACASSTNRAPRHGHHDVRSHRLDQRNSAVDGFSPSSISCQSSRRRNARIQTHPETLQLCSRLALRSSRSGNCQRWWTSFSAPICTNPVKQMSVIISHDTLSKSVLTSSDTLHDLLPRLQALTPVVFPLKQVTRVQRISPQLKHTAELSWRCRRPEAEFLHKTCALRFDELLQLVVELGKLGVVLDRVKGLVVAGVALVFPDVHKGVAVAHFSTPGANEVHLGRKVSSLKTAYLPACPDIPCSQASLPSSGTNFPQAPRIRPPCSA